jgi:hypothetical protein
MFTPIFKIHVFNLPQQWLEFFYGCFLYEFNAQWVLHFACEGGFLIITMDGRGDRSFNQSKTFFPIKNCSIY